MRGMGGNRYNPLSRGGGQGGGFQQQKFPLPTANIGGLGGGLKGRGGGGFPSHGPRCCSCY